MRLPNLAIVLAAGTAGAVAALSIYGSHQIMNPPRCDHRDDPESWGLPCDEIEFQASDGLRLAGWLARSEQSKAAVIIAHGHGGNRHTNLAYASFLFPEYTVLLLDLRGHGDSDGRHTSVGHYERRDVIGAAEYLRQRGYGPIGVLGISMGAATAILAAGESSAIDAVVADSAFAALRHAVREAARLRGYPGPLVRPLAYLTCQAAAWRLRYSMRSGDPLRVVAAIAPRPLLLIHGAEDTFISPDNAEALYAEAGEPKELWMLPGVEHARAIEAFGPEYRERVMGFFAKALGAQAAGGGAHASGSGPSPAVVGEELLASTSDALRPPPAA